MPPPLGDKRFEESQKQTPAMPQRSTGLSPGIVVVALVVFHSVICVYVFQVLTMMATLKVITLVLCIFFKPEAMAG